MRGERNNNEGERSIIMGGGIKEGGMKIFMRGRRTLTRGKGMTKMKESIAEAEQILL